MADSILLLKSGLEFARFADPVLRQRIYNAIDRLNDDLQAHDYEFDVVLENTFDELKEQIEILEEADMAEETVEVDISIAGTINNGDDEGVTEVNGDDEDELDSLVDSDDDDVEVIDGSEESE